MKKAIYPGSFDPFHEGHLSIYNKAIKLFDEVIIYVTNNDEKTHQEILEKRKENILSEIPNCKIIADTKLTSLIAQENDSFYIVRGLRTFDEVEYELFLASINKRLNQEVETIIIFSDDEMKNISSSKIREIKNKYKDDFQALTHKK
ncbi:pantetheine-phosphate adenylyltransferase [Mycoplasma todarodis]|uniref:Phosphopantetheine adenylyltransferase n=1 Tax=Mycoplasma todarodis TaxID=1937191 RepID=A0A4R0XNT2_9MOLU|nr:pantetheine-phosphate adenylyltransferase [Mycoplasma todarodis]TCG10615.1 pantetheine-phosphate adenylyltransferase [Mycoplasma todarodis]